MKYHQCDRCWKYCGLNLLFGVIVYVVGLYTHPMPIYLVLNFWAAALYPFGYPHKWFRHEKEEKQ